MPLPENFRPSVGLVLGSGLGSFTEQIDVQFTIPYADLPGMPVSTVAGHAGQLLGATVGQSTWALLKGRVHLYEGRPAADVTAGIRLLKSLGCHTVILTNAAGTLHPQHPPGSWMQITDHLNLTGTSPLLGGANFVDMTEIYDRSLVASFERIASELSLPLHQGVYAGLLGPQYENPHAACHGSGCRRNVHGSGGHPSPGPWHACRGIFLPDELGGRYECGPTATH